MKRLVDKSVKEKDNFTLEAKATNPHKLPFKWLKDGEVLNTDLLRYALFLY